ncbi:Teneurin-3 [Thelohanellus kitauei]|uniref:Teneurin-3 n=1 Tax=Thelohanellus kitauei TaxID=669202 RepID=A0A0C2J532_THEKT|nr:Teneurin-3 [Thelohanellus kitauei]
MFTKFQVKRDDKTIRFTDLWYHIGPYSLENMIKSPKKTYTCNISTQSKEFICEAIINPIEEFCYMNSKDVFMIAGAYENLKTSALHIFKIFYNLHFNQILELTEIWQMHFPKTTNRIRLRLASVKNPKAHEKCQILNGIFRCNDKNEIVCRDPYKDINYECAVDKQHINYCHGGKMVQFKGNNTNHVLKCECQNSSFGHRCQHKSKCVHCVGKKSGNILKGRSCRSGWTGITCNTRECIPGFCLNGECHIENNQRKCKCLSSFFSGKHCELDCVKLCNNETYLIKSDLIQCDCGIILAEKLNKSRF